MATRYTADFLIFLRESPLCLKPAALPPAEEWMGPATEAFRNNQGTEKTGKDRSKNGDGSLLDQTNRRQGAERHAQRNSANPEDIILGPPRTTFSSATLGRGNKPFENDKTFKDSDRFATFRRNGDGDPDRFRDRERGDRDRDGRNNFRRRGDADQDSEGWSTVKPRKSFGHEGAERFHGRMGGDRTERPAAGERRAKDAHQDENAERPPRRGNFGEFGRDKEGDDGERPRRNGLTRNRSDQPSWARGHNGDNDAPATRERFDRGKSWRDRDPDAHHADEKPHRERNVGRWDRDQRQEREPEWLDEAPEDKPQGRTAEDIQKFLASMKAGQNAAATAKPEPSTPGPNRDSAAREAALETEQPKIKSAPAVELGPDKFFANFAPTPPADVVHPMETPKEVAPSKAKTGSRFQGFFASQEVGRQSEPSTPVAPPPPTYEAHSLLAALASPAPKPVPNAGPGNHPDAAEKLAFDALIQKLHKQSLSVGTPPSGGFPVPPPSGPEKGPQNSMGSPGPYALFGQEPRDDHMNRGPPPQELHAQRPPQASHPIIRTEQQLLQDLIGQRHPMANQPAVRSDQSQSRNSNSNAEFLMNLMQSGRNPPSEAQRVEPLLRMPQPSRPAPIPQTPDREPDYQRERSASQHHGRPQGLPGFFDEPQLHHESDARRHQPTQILQRQVPPGLDQMHPSWLQGNNQQLPPGPGRPMIPPPGLAGNPRNGPLPGMFPPNFPMGGFPPEAMAGPPRNMPPPPGFFNGPPPGFMPPPGMGGAFHGGPELAFGFDGRGMPPPGAANFRRN